MGKHWKSDLARYSIEPDRSGDGFRVYDNALGKYLTHRPVSWNDAHAVAEHMERVFNHSRQIDEDDPEDEPEPSRIGGWSLGDWQDSVRRNGR